MEMTRRVITNVAEPEGTRGADGPDHQAARVSGRRVPRRHRAQRRHALHHGVLRRRQGALGAQHARHEGPLLPVPDARRLDQRVPGARASAPPAPARRPTPSPARAGRARCRPASSEYKSPTSIVWLLGRIYCTGTPEDYAAVHALQDEFKLVPLSAYGKPYTPPPGKVDPSIDMKTAGARPGQPHGRGRLLHAAGRS